MLWRCGATVVKYVRPKGVLTVLGVFFGRGSATFKKNIASELRTLVVQVI